MPEVASHNFQRAPCFAARRATALKILFAAYISIFTKALPSRTIGKVASTTLGGSPP